MVHRRPARVRVWLLAGLALLGACRAPAPSPRPGPAGPAGPAPTPTRPPGAQPPGTPPPQFTFSSWRKAVLLIRQGKVVQTVSGRGGFALILDDHTWVHLVAEPGDPLPRDPKAFIDRNAPNARAIKHTTE